MSDTPTPWYKQFWPWFLIIVPLVSMILSFTMLRLSLTTENSLVVDDYYKEGKSINADLGKRRFALALGLRAQVLVDEYGVAVKLDNIAIDDFSALKLSFYHATQAPKDFELTLLKDASGIFRATHEQDIEQKWILKLTPLDDEWEIRQSISLPSQGWQPLTP